MWDLVDWLAANKTWVFSGIGVAALTGIFLLLRRLVAAPAPEVADYRWRLYYIAVGFVAALALLLVFVGIGLFEWRPGDDLLVQTGTIRGGADGSDPADVYYPIPYESPPELKFDSFFDVRLVEQRAEGFRVRFGTYLGGGHWSGPPLAEWRATGLRKRSR